MGFGPEGVESRSEKLWKWVGIFVTLLTVANVLVPSDVPICCNAPVGIGHPWMQDFSMDQVQHP